MLCVEKSPNGLVLLPSDSANDSVMVLTHHEAEEFDYFEWEPPKENGPPTYVEIRHKNGSNLGWATIYYDNYIMVVKELSVAEALNTRIIRNCKKFNVEIKEHFFQSRNSLLTEPCKTLGLELKFIRDGSDNRKRPRNEVFELHWRLSARVDHTPCQRRNDVLTPREIAATIGRILYARMVEGPLGRQPATRAVLKTLSRISRTAWKMSWDHRGISLSTPERENLEEEWAHVELNPWRCELQRRTTTTTLFVATDACQEGWAFVILDAAGQVRHSSGVVAFNDDLRPRHIYIKELFAAIQGIRVCQRDTTAKVYIITDNTACAWGLKKGYSSNEEAMRMMLEVDLENIEVITIPSAGNVADAPSRGRPVEEEKRAVTWEVIQQHLKGRVSSADVEQTRYRSTSENNGLRHNEADNDEAWCPDLLDEPVLRQY